MPGRLRIHWSWIKRINFLRREISCILSGLRAADSGPFEHSDQRAEFSFLTAAVSARHAPGPLIFPSARPRLELRRRSPAETYCREERTALRSSDCQPSTPLHPLRSLCAAWIPRDLRGLTYSYPHPAGLLLASPRRDETACASTHAVVFWPLRLLQYLLISLAYWCDTDRAPVRAHGRWVRCRARSLLRCHPARF